MRKKYLGSFSRETVDQEGARKRRNAVRDLLSVGCITGFLTGRAHVISKDLLKRVDREIPFEKLREDPHTYVGELVLLGGIIVKAAHKKEGILVEV